MRQWRLIYDPPTPGRLNMAVDEAILNAVAARSAPPTLRLYGWSPACLSLGYGQPGSDAAIDRLAHYGWDAVRRPTGGKAILHTDELTYSLALPAGAGGHPVAAVGIVESYLHISRALLAALEGLGLRPQSERRADDTRADGAVCFETPSHYEITVGGRKLVGSAQTRRRDGLLQHGSLPLTGDLARICDALAYPDEAARQQAKSAVRARAVTLSEALGRAVTWDEAADALAWGFETVFGLDLAVGTLSAAEEAHADTLARGRYASIARRDERQPTP
jgi:lipoate-protein ligase A